MQHREGRVLNKCLIYSTERLRPEVQPLTLLYTSFHEKLLSYTFY